MYSAQTLAGAEGIYLDELLGRRGIYRRGKTRGSGTIQMVINQHRSLQHDLQRLQHTALTAETYVLTQDTPVAGNYSGTANLEYVIGFLEITRFNMINQNDGSIKTYEPDI
ncbi:putative baseplate component [Salmonella phage 21]|nr:putative baseplate component [Salmonella phage 21]